MMRILQSGWLLVLISVFQVGGGYAAQSPAPSQPQGFRIKSSAFSANEMIPQPYAALGANKSPSLSWSGLPEGTKELALIVEDPDAAPFHGGKPFIHWVAYGIRPETKELPEGLTLQAEIKKPVALKQGKNSADRTGYTGPKPPAGSGIHHYHFRLYALDVPLKLKPNTNRDQLMGAMQGHVLAVAELTGLYELKRP